MNIFGILVRVKVLVVRISCYQWLLQIFILAILTVLQDVVDAAPADSLAPYQKIRRKKKARKSLNDLSDEELYRFIQLRSYFRAVAYKPVEE